RGAETIRRAYTLRDRVSEREKLYIASRYDMYVTGNLDSARKTNELWAQTYPQEYLAYLALYGIYDALGDLDKAIAALKEALRLNPASAVEYSNLVGEYLSLGRLNDARAAAKEARDRNLDSPDTHRWLYLVDFLQHDPVAMEHDAAFSMGKPGDEDLMLYLESNTAAYGGQFAKSRELSRRAVESALRAEGKEAAAADEADAAIREALVGNIAIAKQQAHRAIALSHGKYVLGQAAFALALAGDTAQALSLADDLEKRFPEDTLIQLWLPAVRAEAALRNNNTQRAMEELAPTSAYDKGSGVLARVWLRGQIHLAARRSHEAAVEFKWILDHPGYVSNTLFGPLAHLGLARAYAMQGDSAGAKAACQSFLTLWKDADPDILILKQAKAEYAKLQ
ncbi:MAG TPA: hypothetical protein VFJ47_08445, partial [Terriglobales bacterium]|nr:hypothetical protein [Terriglobales bacterium]